MNRRQYLTPAEKQDMLRAQRWRCVCREGCNQPLWPGAPVRWDHRPPLALGGTAKPNQAVTPHCHDALTKQDVKRISKADRQGKAYRGEKKRKGRKLESRPMPKAPEGHKYRWPKRRVDGSPVRAEDRQS